MSNASAAEVGSKTQVCPRTGQPIRSRTSDSYRGVLSASGMQAERRRWLASARMDLPCCRATIGSDLDSSARKALVAVRHSRRSRAPRRRRRSRRRRPGREAVQESVAQTSDESESASPASSRKTAACSAAPRVGVRRRGGSAGSPRRAPPRGDRFEHPARARAAGVRRKE